MLPGGTWLRYDSPLSKTSIRCVISLRRSTSEIYTNCSTAGNGNCESCSTHARVGQLSVGTPEQIWLGTEYLTHTRLRTTDCPGRGESLYRLQYPGLKYHKYLRTFFFFLQNRYSARQRKILVAFPYNCLLKKSGSCILYNWQSRRVNLCNLARRMTSSPSYRRFKSLGKLRYVTDVPNDSSAFIYRMKLCKTTRCHFPESLNLQP